MDTSERRSRAGASRVGRPRRSSPVMLEEAAAELFLEQSYDGTTIDEISTRAGVARTTFFNYFATKGDLLWVELDAAIPRLRSALDASDGRTQGLEGVEEALAQVADGISATRVPWAIAHRELMGTTAELRATGLVRLLEVVDVITRHLSRREPTLDEAGARAAASAIAGGAMAGAADWIATGTARGPLADHVRAGVHPVIVGWRARIGAVD